MIDPEVAIALHDAIDEHINVSTRNLIGILVSLDTHGWQLTRKPEPIVEPVPAQPLVPTVPMTPRPAWLPSKIEGLWIDLGKHGIVPLFHKAELDMWKDGFVIVEADSLADAQRVFNTLPSTTLKRFELDGKTYEYRSDKIPF